MASVQPEVKELIDAVRSNGYQVVVGGKHAKILRNGEAVLDVQGGAPLTLPTTPSDHRWRANNVARLLRNQVLTVDPRKAGQKKTQSNRPNLTDPAIRERARAGTKKLAEERKAATKILRSRMERTLKPIGVWKPAGRGAKGWKGTVAEVARICFHWGSSSGKFDKFFESENGAKNSMRLIYEGDAVIDWVRGAWHQFLDELEQAPDPTARYYDLLRQMQAGATTTEEEDEPVEEEEESGVEPETTALRLVAANGNHGAPLALRALALMAHNANGRGELDRSIELAQEILELEEKTEALNLKEVSR